MKKTGVFVLLQTTAAGSLTSHPRYLVGGIHTPTSTPSSVAMSCICAELDEHDDQQTASISNPMARGDRRWTCSSAQSPFEMVGRSSRSDLGVLPYKRAVLIRLFEPLA